MSSTLRHVMVVICHSAHLQMVGIAAAGYVAAVPNHLTRRDVAVHQLERYTVCKLRSTADIEYSVAK